MKVIFKYLLPVCYLIMAFFSHGVTTASGNDLSTITSFSLKDSQLTSTFSSYSAEHLFLSKPAEALKRNTVVNIAAPETEVEEFQLGDSKKIADPGVLFTFSVGTYILKQLISSSESLRAFCRGIFYASQKWYLLYRVFRI